jgi:hypothetical protein
MFIGIAIVFFIGFLAVLGYSLYLTGVLTGEIDSAAVV